MEIIKKTYSNLFEKILSGEKKFDRRLDEFEVQKGDILVLKEINEKREFTGREIKKTITFVARTKELKYWDDKEINEKGFVIMRLE